MDVAKHNLVDVIQQPKTMMLLGVLTSMSCGTSTFSGGLHPQTHSVQTRGQGELQSESFSGNKDQNVNDGTRADNGIQTAQADEIPPTVSQPQNGNTIVVPTILTTVQDQTSNFGISKTETNDEKIAFSPIPIAGTNADKISTLVSAIIVPASLEYLGDPKIEINSAESTVNISFEYAVTNHEIIQAWIVPLAEARMSEITSSAKNYLNLPSSTTIKDGFKYQLIFNVDQAVSKSRLASAFKIALQVKLALTKSTNDGATCVHTGPAYAFSVAGGLCAPGLGKVPNVADACDYFATYSDPPVVCPPPVANSTVGKK